MNEPGAASGTGIPRFAIGSPLLEGAYRVAREGHQRHRKEGGDDVSHPVAVAEVLDREGFDDVIVAAGLLHDVVEDTSIDLAEISSRFGHEICELVAEMTEDEAIDDYRERKVEHRGRVSRDPRAAAVYAADKLARARELEETGESPSPERLEHYLETLRTLRKTNPDLPFLADLERELARLSQQAPRRG